MSSKHQAVPAAASVPAGLREIGTGLANLPARCRPSRLILVSAENRSALIEQLETARANLATADDIELPRPDRHASHRLAIVARDTTDLAAKLETAAAKLSRTGSDRLAFKRSIYFSARPSMTGDTAVLFPGQGSQHPGMLDELCLTFPGVRSWFEEIDRTAADLPIPSPTLLAFPPRGGLDQSQEDYLRRGLYNLKGGAQLSLVANMALHELLCDLGFRGDRMAGHSNGEHAALFASGTFRGGRTIVFKAIRAMLEAAITRPPPQRPEAVLTVNAGRPSILERILEQEAGALFLAMINCPSQRVLAGLEEAVNRAIAGFRQAGLIAVRVPLDRAYHTPLFATWGRWLRQIYELADAGPGTVRTYSCQTSAPYPEEPESIRDLAALQWSSTVDFENTIRRLYDDGVRVFVEVGPGNSLTSFVGDTLRGRPHLALSSGGGRGPALEQLRRLYGTLFVHGLPVSLDSVAAGRLLRRSWTGERQGVATVPSVVPAAVPPVSHEPRSELARAHFELMADFLASLERVSGRAIRRLEALGNLPEARRSPAAGAGRWPLLGSAVRGNGRQLNLELRFDLDQHPLLRDHSLGGGGGSPGLAVLPFTFSLELIAQTALALLGGGVVVAMSSVKGHRWLALDRGTLAVGLCAEALPGEPGQARVRVFQVEDEQWNLAFEGEVSTAAGFPPVPRGGAPLQVLEGPRRWTPESFYRDYAFHGPAFRRIHRVHGVGQAGIEASLAPPAAAGGSRLGTGMLDPTLLDCSGQLVGFWLLEHGYRDFGIFPFQLQRLCCYREVPGAVGAVECRIGVGWQAQGTTLADVEFVDRQGRLIYRLEGFAQRYLSLPEPFARAVMGSARHPLSVPVEPAGALAVRVIHSLPHRFLGQSWGIWSRALAHQVLGREEIDEWYARQARNIPWLLGRIVAKETVQAWARQHHALELPLADLVLVGGASGLVEVQCPELAQRTTLPVLNIRHEDERCSAQALATT